MSDPFPMTAQMDDAIVALQLALRIAALVKIRHDVLEHRRTSLEPSSEGLQWIGYPHTKQDPEIAALCDALAALLRGGRGAGNV